jgi:hypothetical protein
MSVKVTGFVPESVISAHRRGREFVEAVARGDRRTAQKVLTKILKDKDGQTSWYLTDWYLSDVTALERLRALFPPA